MDSFENLEQIVLIKKHSDKLQKLETKLEKLKELDNKKSEIKKLEDQKEKLFGQIDYDWGKYYENMSNIQVNNPYVAFVTFRSMEG